MRMSNGPPIFAFVHHRNNDVALINTILTDMQMDATIKRWNQTWLLSSRMVYFLQRIDLRTEKYIWWSLKLFDLHCNSHCIFFSVYYIMHIIYCIYQLYIGIISVSILQILIVLRANILELIQFNGPVKDLKKVITGQISSLHILGHIIWPLLLKYTVLELDWRIKWKYMVKLLKINELGQPV